VKIACERCEKVGDPSLNMRDWGLLLKSRTDEKIYLCPACYDKFLEFLDGKSVEGEDAHD